jgi:hypothetical protein
LLKFKTPESLHHRVVRTSLAAGVEQSAGTIHRVPGQVSIISKNEVVQNEFSSLQE